MRRLTTEEVKKIQIEILDVVAAFCEENNINYWLDSGTLLGAVRHKGYIPWDDDIDIGMLRPDYDKFAELFNKSNDRYRFVDIDNTPDFYVAFGKVIDTKTVLYEPDKNGDKLAVNIDIFIYDNAPDDDNIVKKMYDRRDRLAFMSLFSRGNQIISTDTFIRRIIKKATHICFVFVSSANCVKKISENSQKYSKEKTKRVGNFTAVTRIASDKKIFSSFVDVDFEGKKYNAPVGYDEWLTDFYGDYMQLPPKEKQVTHHQYEAYLL